MHHKPHHLLPRRDRMSESQHITQGLIASNHAGNEITLFYTDGRTVCIDLKYLSLCVDDTLKEIMFSYKEGRAAHAKEICVISGTTESIKNFATKWLKFHVPS